MFDLLKLSDLKRLNCRILKEPTNTRPTIWLIEENGVRAIIKDFSTCRVFFRNSFGRFLIWREQKAYKKIGDLKCVPKLFRNVSGLALVIEEIQGMDLRDAKKSLKIDKYFFQELRDNVEMFHKRGMAHCDLKKAGNIVVGKDGHPYIIDWAAAISESEMRIPFMNKIYNRFIIDDHNAVIKHQLHHIPESVPLQVKDQYYSRNLAEKIVRAIRDRLRYFLQAVA